MPVYDYKCPGCGYRFEEARRVGDHVRACPMCGGALRQVYHSFVFRMRRPRLYSPETSERRERHMAAMIGEDELERGK